MAGERRMEAQAYLSKGSLIRLAMERGGDVPTIEDIANVTQPPRLKGILVSPAHGSPFLSATQVFDVRPTARKFLALERMPDAKECFVEDGDILVTRSGTVGRTLAAYAAHRNTVLSDDLLRVKPKDLTRAGWIYAYLQSQEARAMCTGAQYGHVIKHLETSHLAKLPIPAISDETAERLAKRFSEIVRLRNESYESALEAERRFAAAVGPIGIEPTSGFSVRASDIFGKRRRMEAAYHAPTPAAIRKRFQKTDPLFNVTKRVWWMTRFRRFYGDKGIPYVSADELFTINPTNSKRILVKPDDGHEEYFVKRGWILMACSGQTYGLNGAAILATEYDERAFYSHDLIRIIPDPSRVRAGYLLVALTHPTHGRPLLIRAAYGTSIPHLDPGDVSNFPVVRLDTKEESLIADLAERSATERAKADAIERSLAAEAGEIIASLAHRSPIRLVSHDVPAAPRVNGNDAGAKFDSLAARWISERPRGANVHSMIDTPAYREIIEMGDKAIRPILLQLKNRPTHWFHALHAITNQNPVPADAEGNVKQMAEAWIKWGKSQGYLSDMD